VVAVTGHDADYIIWKMPLRQVFVWEHVHFEQNGWTCYPPQVRVTLEDVWDALGKPKRTKKA
jgi:hypothetical protein